MIILSYLTRMLLTSALLFGFYHFLLRNQRFHRFNRIFLLLATVISVVIPLVSIPVAFPSRNSPQETGLARTLRVISFDGWREAENGLLPPSPASTGPDWPFLFSLIYLAGALPGLIAIARGLLQIYRLSRKYHRTRLDDITLYDTTEPDAPFSFFRLIFWHRDIPLDSAQGRQIFRHELTHISQRHSADLLWMELLCALGWFNPFYHLIRRELKLIHEFLADAEAIGETHRLEYAELLLVHAIRQKKARLAHPFSRAALQRRISMLTSPGSTRTGGLGLRLTAALFSIMLICICAFRPSTQPIVKPSGPQQPFTVMIDAGHGGPDPGAQAGKVEEKDLTLAIARKIALLAPQYQLRVLLTRQKDELPGEFKSIADIRQSLIKRIEMTKGARADLFISIHVNFTGDAKDARHGFEAYVSGRKEDLPAKTLATALLRQLGAIYEASPQIMQRSNSGVYVLDHNVCPAVILECGYIDQPADLAFISDPENQNHIAGRILEGINQYRQAGHPTP